MTRKTYCGNLLWQSGLTLLAPAAVRVKAVERNSEPVEQHIWTLFASHAHLRVWRFAPVR